MPVPNIKKEVVDAKFSVAGQRLNIYEIARILASMKHEAERIENALDKLKVIRWEIKNALDETNALCEWWNPERTKFMEEYQYVLRELIDCDDPPLKMALPEDPTQKPCYVYYILNQEKDKVKIGISNDPVQRAKGLQTASGEEIEILHTIKFDSRYEAHQAEQYLHSKFSQWRKRPSKVAKTTEWFDASIVDILMSEYVTRESIFNHKKAEQEEITKRLDEIDWP